jgi:2-haloacid dehalogenase
VFSDQKSSEELRRSGGFSRREDSPRPGFRTVNGARQARPYRWLLFDADGTLFDYDRAESAALAQVFAKMGVPFDAACLRAYRRINQALWQKVETGEITPGAVKLRRFELLLAGLGLEHSPGAFSSTYLECLATCSELMAEAEETLRVLGGKFRLAILTNGLKEVQRGRLARSAIRPYISEIIISEEIGFAKPAGQFFDAALARLDRATKADVLMIGDGWASDIEGAVRYGIDACWYNPAGKPRPSALPIAGEIASLRGLIGWLSYGSPR